MPRNPSDNPNDLKPAQEVALAALLTGASVTAAAEAANVDRTTVSRWLAEPKFQARFNLGRRHQREIVFGRIVSLTEKASRCVEKAIDSGDARVALALLKEVVRVNCDARIDPDELRMRNLFDSLHYHQSAKGRGESQN